MENLPIILQLHTPDELIYLSNLAHWIEGAFFAVVVIIAFVQTTGIYRANWLKFAWPSLILLAGLFLPIFSYSHHWNEMGLAWKATIMDAQQRQHFYIAIIAIIAGAMELYSLKAYKLWPKMAFPAAFLIIGLLFITHEQHGTSEAVMRAAAIHQYIGISLILASVFRAAEIWTKGRLKLAAYLWMLFLLIASGLLISYREPEGAYQIEMKPQNNLQIMH